MSERKLTAIETGGRVHYAACFETRTLATTATIGEGVAEEALIDSASSVGLFESRSRLGAICGFAGTLRT